MSAKKEEEKKEGHAEGEAAPKKGKKKLIIIIALVLILAGAGVPFLLGGGDKKAEENAKHEEEEHEAEKHYKTAKLETFIVNLSENTTFLKVTLLLEYDPAIVEAAEKAHGHGAEGEEGGGGGGHGSGGGEAAPAEGALPPVLEARKPMINDAIIRVLSSKKASDVLTSDGKEQLKQDLIEAINEASGLDEGPIVNIYFTEFIIQ